ncbi:MAG: DUF134 domain-containing protein [Paludibacter sp.]|nr:DUF134 domain-containing protein [Paludibacter sp.]
MLRKVLNPPKVNGFKPYGQGSEKLNLESVNLLYEEYEAIRLSDYDALNHHQASVMMGVSRPTFTRIYASALQKVAKAFVEGRQISIKGGAVYFDSDWYHCNTCKCYFNNPERDKIVENCSLCGSQQVNEFDYTYEETGITHCNDLCVCPSCGFEQKHQYGKKCNQERCPTCGAVMKRAL